MRAIFLLFTAISLGPFHEPGKFSMKNSNTRKIDPTREIKNWYNKEVPYQRPKEAIRFEKISEIEDYEGKDAENVSGIIISLGNNQDSLYLNKIVSFSKFKNLEYLLINNSPFAPYDFEGLPNLKTLIFNNVYNLKELPKSIGKLTDLEHLLILGANEITSLPEGIFDLENLISLQISGVSPKCNSISGKVGKLQNLEYLYLLTCSINVPIEIGQLHKLKELRIENYYNYSIPTKEIYCLPRLEILGLYLNHKSELEGIENLQNLKVLHLVSKYITPSIGELKNLEGLSILNYEGENYPKELGHLQNLKAFKIGSNNSLLYAPNFIPSLKNLEFLEIKGCQNLKHFGFEYTRMSNIESIKLSHNGQINEIPKNLAHLKGIVTLK